MKRPEGFDPLGPPPPPGGATGGAARRAPRLPSPKQPPKYSPKQPGRQSRPKLAPVQPQPRSAPRDTDRGPASRAGAPDAAARANLRRAARARRRFERAEVRRFTRRARNRRIAGLTAGGTVVTLLGLVLVAVYSPLLALRTITVDGTSRVDVAAVQSAVADQLGTPLALVDFGRITTRLSAFPLIRSYVSETVPPDTLLIHVVERQPVGQLPVAAGFRLVDPAGVTIQQSAARTAGLPVIDLPGSDASSPAFGAIVAVLLSLPPGLLLKVDAASASTRDDVSLVLVGVGQRVRWGGAGDSATKAKLLAALIAVTDPARAGEFDVSAPSNGVFRPS